MESLAQFLSNVLLLLLAMHYLNAKLEGRKLKRYFEADISAITTRHYLEGSDLQIGEAYELRAKVIERLATGLVQYRFNAFFWYPRVLAKLKFLPKRATWWLTSGPELLSLEPKVLVDWFVRMNQYDPEV